MYQSIEVFICGVISALEVFIFGKIVFDRRGKISKKELLFLILTAFSYTLIYMFFTNFCKTILMFIVSFIFYRLVFRVSNKKSVFLVFLFLVIVMMIDLLDLFFIVNVLKFSKDFICNEFAGTIIGNLVTFLIFVFVSYIFKKWLKKLIETEVDKNIQIIVFSILISICVFFVFYIIIQEYILNEKIIVYLVVIVVLLLVLFSLIKQTIENNKLTKKYDKLLEFMTTYEKEIEKQRTLRHETKNEFLSIKAKIKDKTSSTEIVNYIDSILGDKLVVKQEDYAKFCYLPANGIKGLCYFKTQEAENKGLNVSINISKRIEKSNLYSLSIRNQKDLGRILGVFLDNAVEASLESKDKKFGIEIYLNIHRDSKIIISNSYEGVIDKERIGSEKFSTKGKNRGHGLLLVNHIVGNNDIFEIKTEVTNKLYVQTIIVKNK